MVSEFGSSIVRVNLERADGESSLGSFLVVIASGESTTVMGDIGRAAAVAVVVLLAMMEPSSSWLESVLVYC